MDYTPIDIRGSVLEGQVVNYACKNESAILNDGSGMGVYEAECINGTVGPTTWPACDIQVCRIVSVKRNCVNDLLQSKNQGIKVNSVNYKRKKYVIISKKGSKFPFRAPIGALVYFH